MIYGIGVLLLVITCAVHAYRNGNAQPWLYIILLFNVVGCVVYIAAVVVPSFAGSRQADQLATGVRKLVDPDRDLRARLQQAELVDSADAKHSLADECIKRGDFAAAIKLLQGAAQGMHADDPGLLYSLARAHYGAEDYVAAQSTLDHLREKNPNWQSGEAHLLYARALEGQNKEQEALADYAAVAQYFAGEEAKVRYGLYLQKLGRIDEARAVFEAVVKAGERAGKFQRQMQREWYNVAKRNLGQ